MSEVEGGGAMVILSKAKDLSRMRDPTFVGDSSMGSEWQGGNMSEQESSGASEEERAEAEKFNEMVYK